MYKHKIGDKFIGLVDRHPFKKGAIYKCESGYSPTFLMVKEATKFTTHEKSLVILDFWIYHPSVYNKMVAPIIDIKSKHPIWF